MRPLEGRVALVTGVGRRVGIGYAIAARLLESGASVLAHTWTPNPGPTDSGWGIGDEDPTSAMPLGRWGEPDDAARLIAWLCTDDARWNTGQVINSEGGFRRW
jgi:3-oxoacyl-[acyl-carrier protein] reductase